MPDARNVIRSAENVLCLLLNGIVGRDMVGRRTGGMAIKSAQANIDTRLLQIYKLTAAMSQRNEWKLFFGILQWQNQNDRVATQAS